MTFEGVTIGERGIDGETEVPDFDSHITTEVVMLHDHAAETLLRLYVAHAAAPTMPWIDVAERRNFREFKKMIREEFVDITRPPSEFGRVCLANGLGRLRWSDVKQDAEAVATPLEGSDDGEFAREQPDITPKPLLVTVAQAA